MHVWYAPGMLTRLLNFYRTGTDRPPFSDDPRQIQKAYKARRWSVFLTLTIGYGLFYTTRLSLSVVKEPLVSGNVFTPAQLGTIGSALLLIYAFGRLTNGFLADRANIRRFMATGLMVSALINLVLGFTSGFWVFLVLWGMNGWFQSMGSAPSVVSMTQWFSHSERGSRYGIWSTSHCIGEGITFAGTAWVVSTLNWQAGFWAPGALCVLAALVILRTLSDRPQTLGLPPVSEYRNDHPPRRVEQPRSVSRRQFEVLKNPWIWVLGFSNALMYVARYGINNWSIWFLQSAKGHDLMDASLVAATAPFAGFVGSAASGIISDRLFGARRNWPTLLYGILQVGSLVFLYLVPEKDFWTAAVAMSMFGFATGGLLVFLGGLMAIDIASEKATGAAMGVVGLVAYLGAGLQDIISGLLIDATKQVEAGRTTYSFDSAFAFWTAAAALSMLLAASAWKVRARE